MEKTPLGAYVSRSSLEMREAETPEVGRGRRMEVPRYTSTPMDEQVEVERRRADSPVVGRGRGMVAPRYQPSAGVTPVGEEEGDGNYSDYEERKVQLDEDIRQSRQRQYVEAKRQWEERHRQRAERIDAEKEELMEKFAEERRQWEEGYKREVDKKEDEKREQMERYSEDRRQWEEDYKREQGLVDMEKREQMEEGYKQEQYKKDGEIRRLSGLLDGARSMVRVLSSFSEVKMGSLSADATSGDYGPMPKLENVNAPSVARVATKEKDPANDSTVSIGKLLEKEGYVKRDQGSGGKLKKREAMMDYDSDPEGENFEWHEKYMRREERERQRQREKSQERNKSEPNRERGGAKMKPSSYDGLTPYEDYRVQFQMLAELNQWTTGNKALYLAGCLSKGARSVLNDLSPADRYDYDKLDEALKERYGTEDQAELFKAKLRSRVKTKEESLQELAHDIRRLVRLAYPGAAIRMHEDLTKDQFIEALGDGEIRWSVFQARPKNITEALKVAMELEAFKESEKTRIRKSVRGITVESGVAGRLEPEKMIEDGEEEGQIEKALQLLMVQVKQMRQVSRNGDYVNKEYPEVKNAGRGNPWMGRVDNEEGTQGRGRGADRGYVNDRGYANERTYDMTKIKSYRCDQMGHFARHCPRLNGREEPKPKDGGNLNDK